jgi:glycosidase
MDLNAALIKDCTKNKVLVVATPEVQGAVVKINGEGTSLEVDVPSEVKIEVTSKDGTEKKTYTLELKGKPIPPPETPELVSLTVNGQTIGVASSMNYATSTTTTASIVATVKNTASFTIDNNAATDGTPISVTISDDSTKSGNVNVEIKLIGNDGNPVIYQLNLKYTVPVKNKIILHAYNYTHLWAWDDSKNYTGGKWPGVQMTDEGNKWYGYTVDVKVCNVIFSNSGNGQNSEHGESREEGEWWYKDGKWTDYNPDRPSTPIITASVESGTYLTAQTVELKGSNSGDVIYYTTDGSAPNQSSQSYSSAITISSNTTLKAVGFNAEANPQMGNVYEFRYVIDANADLEAPVIVPSKDASRYEAPISVTFSFSDNKDASGVTAYYTTDNSTPTESSKKYSGESISIAMDEKITIRILAVDASGNKTVGTYYYSIGKLPEATRWDPRQESIYFLLTARWFDGDKSNTIGDVNCSWTEERANDNIKDDGFTGPEDVAWRGDFKGLVEKLDYIKALGFTCIWITPVVQNRSPLCYHGYHAWDMYKEDARLVSEGYDFQRVIDEAHARGIKICLDIVINHSGRFGLKDFAEIKYNRDPAMFPVPTGWENFTYNENAYQSAYSVINKIGATPSQKFPNNWEYDGLKSPGNYPAGHAKAGQPMPGYEPFIGDSRPFTATDISSNGRLADKKSYNWPTRESYCETIDAVGTPGSLTYDGYKSSKRRIRGHNTGFPTGSGSFDNYPNAHFDSLHEDCPDLNIENPEVRDYVVGAYNRYIDMGVDMFRVDTVMHMHKQTLNEMYWPKLLENAAKSTAVDARGGADFFIFGEVGNFVNNLSDKPAELQQCNYTWDDSITGSGKSSNHLLNGNEYRTIDKSHKAVENSDYVVSAIDIVSHNGFCDGVGGAYGRALSNSSAYWDATYLTWYTDSHDYGPNKGETRWKGDFAGAWSMLFTFRGIPIVYYGSEIQFAAGKPNDWPGGGSNGVNMSLEKTGRSYFGDHLEGSVTATDFGEYTASGEVATTLSSDLSKHLRDLNRIRLAVPALQMGQYSTDGHNGGWAGYKRRYTGTNKITGEKVDSYALVGVGSGTHSWSGVLDGEYVNVITGATVSASGGSIKCAASGKGDAALVVLVKTGLATPAPGKVAKESPHLGF